MRRESSPPDVGSAPRENLAEATQPFFALIGAVAAMALLSRLHDRQLQRLERGGDE